MHFNFDFVGYVVLKFLVKNLKKLAEIWNVKIGLKKSSFVHTYGQQKSNLPTISTLKIFIFLIVVYFSPNIIPGSNNYDHKTYFSLFKT